MFKDVDKSKNDESKRPKLKDRVKQEMKDWQSKPVVEKSLNLRQKVLGKRIAELSSHDTAETAVQNLTKLKDVLADKTLDKNVKNLLTNAEVACTIAGVKPASYVQPSSAKYFSSSKVEGYGELTQKELKQFLDVLKEFGIDSVRTDTKGASEFESKYKLYLVNIFSKERVLDTMKESKLFSESEIKDANKDMGKFLGSYLTIQSIGSKETRRVGVLYGYPIDDVKAHMGNVGSQGNSEKTIKIEGMNGTIGWGSSNPNSKSVKDKIELFQTVLDLEKSILA